MIEITVCLQKHWGLGFWSYFCISFQHCYPDLNVWSYLPELDKTYVLACVVGLSLLETGAAFHTVSSRQNKSTQRPNNWGCPSPDFTSERLFCDLKEEIKQKRKKGSNFLTIGFWVQEVNKKIWTNPNFCQGDLIIPCCLNI